MQKKNKIWVGALLIGMSLLFLGCKREDEFPYLEKAQLETEENDALLPESPERDLRPMDEASEESSDKVIYVQVAGEVNQPGVYALSANARVFEAIMAAGGLTQQASQTCVNQAQRLEDGQLIQILSEDEMEELARQAKADEPNDKMELARDEDDRIDINTADEQTLQQIPGIGQARAKDIVTYRNEHGSFQSIEDIKQVSGIKDGLFQKIKEKIKV